MSKYQPESHAANVSANFADSNGMGNGRGLAAGKSRFARNAILGEEVHGEHGQHGHRRRSHSPGGPLLQSRRLSTNRSPRAFQEAGQPRRERNRDAQRNQNEQEKEGLRDASDAEKSEVEAAGDEIQQADGRVGRDHAVERG